MRTRPALLRGSGAGPCPHVLKLDGFVPSPELRNGMRYAIVEAPSGLGLKSKGVEGLPAALLQHGLAERLQARRACRVELDTTPALERDVLTNTLNAPEIASYTRKLADALEPLLSQGEFPIVLGGDCTVVLGSALALKRRGRYGLLFIDGQADFFQP